MVKRCKAESDEVAEIQQKLLDKGINTKTTRTLLKVWFESNYTIQDIKDHIKRFYNYLIKY